MRDTAHPNLVICVTMKPIYQLMVLRIRRFT